MEPVTHFLTGACMSRAGFNRKTALASLTMVLAAEAADLDVLWALKDPTWPDNPAVWVSSVMPVTGSGFSPNRFQSIVKAASKTRLEPIVPL